MLRNFTVGMCVRNSTICMKSCVENFSLLKAQTLINHQHLCPQTSPWEYGWTLYGLLTEVSTERSRATDENMQLPKAPATPLAEKPPGHFHSHVLPSPGFGQIWTFLLHVSQSALCFSWSFFQSKVCSKKMHNIVERNNQTDSEKQQQSLRTIRAYRGKREEEEEDSVDLSWMVAAAGAKDGENGAGGRIDCLVCLLAPASSHCQHHSGKERELIRDSGFPALSIPAVHIRTLLQLSSLWFGPFRASCSEFVWDAATKTVSSPLPCQTLP